MKTFHACLAAIFLFAAAIVPVAAQEKPLSPTGRVPARILPAENASILLMEARDQLEEPERTLDLMQLKDGDVVADIGCGNGYYTLRLAKRVGPTGRVLAVDIQQGMLDQLKGRIEEATVSNVEMILGEPDDPKLPAGTANWVLMVDVYHEFAEPAAMLAKIRECLAPGGKVALLEYRKEQDPASIPFPIPADHKMSVAEVMEEWTPAGFELVERVEALPAQHIFIFKAADAPGQTGTGAVKVGATPNVSTGGGGTFYFSGQPSEADVKTFAHLGIKTVINLRTEEEMKNAGFDEKGTVEGAGMKYLNFPMSGEIPPDEKLDEIFAAIDQAKGESVLVHCASSNRVGALWALYRLKQGGLTADEAIAEGKAAGMKSEAFSQAVRERGSK